MHHRPAGHEAPGRRGGNPSASNRPASVAWFTVKLLPLSVSPFTRRSAGELAHSYIKESESSAKGRGVISWS